MKKVVLLGLMILVLTCPLYSDVFYLWRYREHATDCTALTDGKPRDLCYEKDAAVLYKCDPSSGDCDTSQEWKKVTFKPGGSNGYVLFNDNGNIDGDSSFEYDKEANRLSVGAITVDGNVLYVNSTDNRVGILTTSPSSSLHVNGTITATGWSGGNISTLGSSIESDEITDGTIQDEDISVSTDVRKAQIHFDIDGGGSEITTGLKAWVRVPFNMLITGWDITADQSGSIVVDIYKSNYSSAPPTSNSIAGTEKPTLSNQQRNQDTNLTTWSTSISAGDYIRINIDSVSGVNKVAVDIYGYKD